MKNYSGLYFILASVLLSSTGAVLKIFHNSTADLLLGSGITSCAIGIVLLIYTLFIKKSDKI